jgi:hypothetical protein
VYCATYTEVPVPGSKGKTDIRVNLPSKPKENNMLLKAEQQILNDLSAKLFGNTYYEVNASEWVNLLLGDGFSDTKRFLQAQYKARTAYVRAFAGLTTSRLSQVRKLVPGCSTKKKKDVTSTDLTALLILRSDPVASFAEEIALMDPQSDTFLGVGMVGVEGPIVRLQNEDKQLTKEFLEDLIRKRETYNDLNRTAEQADAWKRYIDERSEQYVEKRAAVAQYIEAMKLAMQPIKKPEFKRFGIDLLIKQANQARIKTIAQGTKGSKGKGKEKTKPAKGETSGLSKAEKTEIDLRSKEVEEKSKKMEEFKAPYLVSQTDFDKIYGNWADRLFEFTDEEGTWEDFVDRIHNPLWSKIQDDRDDVGIFITCLAKGIETFDAETIRLLYPHIDLADFDRLSCLELAIEIYNGRRASSMPKAHFTI